jgi:hypothetical protein
MNDRDLDVVRSIRADLDTPPAGLLERARTRVVTLDDATPAAPHGRSRWARLAIPAAAAAVALTVVAVVVSVTTTAGPAPGSPASGTATVGVTATPEPDTAAEVIEKLARTAAAGPPPPIVRRGQRVHQVYQVLSGHDGAFVREDVWYDPNGMFVLRLLRTNGDGSTEESQVRDESARERQRFAEQGPTPEHPTPAWLASLPTDAAPLWEVFKRCPTPTCAAPAYAPPAFTRLTRMVRASDVLIPPAQRAALLRALATLPDPGVDLVTVRGRTLWAVSHAVTDGSPDRAAVLVDPATARMVGAVWRTAPGAWANWRFWTTELI